MKNENSTIQPTGLDLLCLAAAALLILTLFFATGGCGVQRVPKTAHADTPTPDSITPQALTCGPVDGGTNCHWASLIKDAAGKTLGYCQGDTYMWQSSYSFSLEIGLSQLIEDPNLSGCVIFMPHPGQAVNLHGTLALTPFTGNLTSIAGWIYTFSAAGKKEVMDNQKFMANHSVPMVVALEGSAGEPITFATPKPFDNFLFWFNNDLNGSTPLTISVAGSGDLI